MSMKKTIFIILALSLAGCASNGIAPTVSYYTLTSPGNSLESDIPVRAPIVMSLPTLAAFLTQPKLVVGGEGNKLIFANYHQWAEPLQESILKSLVQGLNAQTDAAFEVVGSCQLCPQVAVTIDHFYPTIDSSVVLAGHYSITHGDASRRQYFRFDRPQSVDGYDGAVADMILLLDELVHHLAQQLSLPKISKEKSE